MPTQSVLSVLYATGRGVPQNYRTAYFWATLAARSGDQLSKDQVALLTPHLTRDEDGEESHSGPAQAQAPPARSGMYPRS